MAIVTEQGRERAGIEAGDDTFVRAPAIVVHEYLRDVPGYRSWWPGARASPRDDGWVDLRGRAPGRMARPLVLTARIRKERPGLGLVLDVTGTLSGTLEWYYVDEVDGAVVHALLHARTSSRTPKMRRADYRQWVRAGMSSLKSVCEDGRRPGEEPSMALLTAQEAARAALRRRIEAARRSRRGRRT